MLSMTAAARAMRIMVVDDAPDTVKATATLFQLDGHEVATADSGKGGLDIAPHFRPELVLLDLAMPEQDGYSVAQRIERLALPTRPYLVAVTGYGTNEDKRRAAQAGFDLHLTKPVGLETYRGLVTLLQTSRSLVEHARVVTAHHRAVATELMRAQLEMAHIYLDTATITNIPSAKISYTAHASRAHERISTWLFSGACSEDQAAAMVQSLRRLRDRISRKNSPAE